MTYSKDSVKCEKSVCFQKMSTKHIRIATKSCLILLMVLCLALAIAAIFRSNSRMNITKTLNFNTNVQSKAADLSKFLQVSNSCRFTNCVVECRNAKKIYEDVYQVLQTTECKENIILKLHNQHFPNSILTNKWKPANKAIKSVTITNSDFMHIRNEAFNSYDFTHTNMLTLLGINLNSLGNGVLLGFADLQFLYLEGKVRLVDRCFFQPVQSSLVRLTLNAQLNISGNENIFGISFMSRLGALDLSDNFIIGSLNRSFFSAVPNLKYLTLSNSQISAIDLDAFNDIAHGLYVLDLTNNHLITLDVKSIEQVLAGGKVNTYLVGNDWLCDCNLKPLINLFGQYEDRFGDVPYCNAPLSFYGVLLTNLTFDENCMPKSELEDFLIATNIHTLKTESLNTTTATSITNKDVSFKMACLSVIGLSDTEEEVTSSSEPLEYFLFAPPCHDFELILLPNNSVQVLVHYADEPINIIWFSEALENFVHTVNGITIDYNCEMYSEPFLVTENLEENCTYTFCLVPSGTFSITPFNCLPLHVPSMTKKDPNIWISSDEKELTVGIVCLILVCSMLLGAVIGFFVIKAYPDILEGSNHVLVVKKSKKTACYISTITEGEYRIHKNSMNEKNSSNALTLQICKSLSLPPELISGNNKEIAGKTVQEVEDYYEMPCIYNKTHDCQEKCLLNKSTITPSSPPPLPKRNSDSTLYGSASELISDVPYPKLSL